MIVLLLTAVTTANAETYSYSDLVGQLTDLSRLAKQPEIGEKAALASSYDRRSAYDAASDKYIDWNADADGDGVVRMEGKEAVLADIQGPGCLFRIWAATASEGHVKIFLDGNATPAVDLPFKGYFDGKNEPFTQPALVYSVTERDKACDNYTPIPFQKSCKIVADPGWGRYYQFNYRQYPAGTVVPTFTRALSPEDTAALARANAVLSDSGEGTVPSGPRQVTVEKNLSAAAGKSTVVFDQKGSGAITSLRVKFALPEGAAAQQIFLRRIALRITWDGQVHPSVWSPWGDFFADSRGATPFQSLPVGLGKDGFWYSHWYMPYGSRATICVDNDGTEPVAMSWEIIRAPLTQPAASLLRFHAKWHRDAFLPTRKDRGTDWNLADDPGQRALCRHTAGRFESARRVVGRGRREILRGRREVPFRFWNRHRGLFWDGLGPLPCFRQSLSRADRIGGF